MRLVSGKNIVVTGCFDGIGRETVKVLAENGANVFACVDRQRQDFENMCHGLSRENKVSVWPVYCDMTDHNSIQNAAKTIEANEIEIHGFISISEVKKDACFNKVTYQDLTETFQINFFSQIVFSQSIVALMQRKNTPGSIVFTSGIAALDGSEKQLAYGASKAALIGAMKTMALELGKSGIRVNAVAPGIILPSGTEALDDGVIEKKIRSTDMFRAGTCKEVADLFMFLMSDLSGHISGQTIRVDGGIG